METILRRLRERLINKEQIQKDYEFFTEHTPEPVYLSVDLNPDIAEQYQVKVSILPWDNAYAVNIELSKYDFTVLLGEDEELATIYIDDMVRGVRHKLEKLKQTQQTQR